MKMTPMPMPTNRCFRPSARLAALFAAGSSPLWMLVFGQGHVIVLGGILTLLIFWRHKANIARIKAGTEPRIGQKA